MKTKKKSVVKTSRSLDKKTGKSNSTKRSGKKPTAEENLPHLMQYPEIKAQDQLMVITERWLSDIQFFKDEIRFLHNLISKYFAWLTSDENIKSTKEIANKLSELEKQRKSIEQAIQQHVHTYINLFENPFSHDRNQFNREHAQLEKELTELVNDFRTIKQKTFVLTESVIQSEKVKHLLSSREEIES